MSLLLSKTNVAPYDYLSQDGAMTNPVVCAVTIDKSGGVITSSSVQLYLVAAGFNSSIAGYSDISITPSTSQEGITWEVSLDDTDFATIINPADMVDAGAQADEIIPVYVRIVANNSETSPLATGNYSLGEFQIAAIENPPAE